MKLKEYKIAQEYLEFLEKNNRKPRAAFRENGKKVSSKNLSPEQKKEVNLYVRVQKEQILMYLPNDASEEYKNIMKRIKELLKEIKIKEEIEEIEDYLKFLEENGREPKAIFTKNGKNLKAENLTKSQKQEQRLYNKWRNSNINFIYKKYLYSKIEKVPEEYREIISRVRKLYKDIEQKEYNSILDEYIEFVQKNGRYPRSSYNNSCTALKREELTEEQCKEVRLYYKLYSSGLREIINLCEEKPLDKIPNEYQYIASRIFEANELVKPKGKLQLAYDYVDFINKYKRKPKHVFYEQRRAISRTILTDEQREELKLSDRLSKSKIWDEVLKYKEMPEEKIPEEYREIVRMLKSAELTMAANSKGVLKYVEFIERNGRFPKGSFIENGEELKKDSLTAEQIEERNIYAVWRHSAVHDIFLKYENQDISKVPEEYREIIGKIRSLHDKIDKEAEVDLINTYISFMEENGRKPRCAFYKEGTRNIKTNLTDEERAELRLYRKAYKKGIVKKIERLNMEKLEDIPEEYREPISRLRKLSVVKNNKLHGKLKSIKALRKAKSERDNAQEINLKAKELENEVIEKTEQEVNKEKE